MKILLSAFDFDPYLGSESATGWNWAYELERAGHQVWVLTSPWGKANVDRYLDVNPIPGLQVSHVDLPKKNPIFGPFSGHMQAVAWQQRALAVARELDSSIDFDLVHHVSWGSLHIGSQLWRLGKPFVFGPVGGGQVAPSGFRRYLRGGWIAEAIRSIMVRHFTRFMFAAKATVSHANLVFVANQETREWVERLAAPRIEYMPAIGTLSSWLRDPSQKRCGRNNKIRILWVGRLLPRKGVLLALEAISRISNEIRFSCTILGDGPQGKYMRRWVDKLGISDQIVWKGSVPWAEAIESYSQHDVFLFTSLRDTDGNQLLEAMAHGAVIVTLNHQGAHTVVPDDAGIKVPVTTSRETVRALARAMERLAKEPATLAAMRQNAIRSAAEHEWSRKVARAIALYPGTDKK